MGAAGAVGGRRAVGGGSRGGGGSVGAGGLGDALVRLAGDRPGLVVLAGPDPGPAAWFAEIWPERVLTVPAPHARLAIAEGIGRAGAGAVVVWDPDATSLPLDPAAGVVVASVTPSHLALAFRAGVAVLQPGWPPDLPALLLGALDRPGSALLHIPEGADDQPHPAAPVSLDGPRVLHRGRDGMVVGAGATAALAAAVAADLAGRGVQVTALEMAVLTPRSGVDPALLHDHLLVGGLDAPRAAALTEVAVGTDFAVLVRAVQAALRG